MAALVDRKSIEHLAKLAKLDLSEDEKNRFGNQLAQILEYVAALQALDVGIHQVELINKVFDNVRTDEPSQSLTADEVLKNAPSSDQGFIKVPSVLVI